MTSEFMFICSLLMFLVVLTIVRKDKDESNCEGKSTTSTTPNKTYYIVDKEHESPYVKYKHLNDTRKLKSSIIEYNLGTSNNSIASPIHKSNSEKISSSSNMQERQVKIETYENDPYISNTDKKILLNQGAPLITPPKLSSACHNVSSNYNKYISQESSSKDIFYSATPHKENENIKDSYSNNKFQRGNVIYADKLEDHFTRKNCIRVTIGKSTSHSDEDSPNYYLDNNAIVEFNSHRNNITLNDAVNKTSLEIKPQIKIPCFGGEEKMTSINTSNFADNFNTEFKDFKSEIKEQSCFKSIVVEQNRKISLSNNNERSDSTPKDSGLTNEKEMSKPAKFKKSIASMIKESLGENKESNSKLINTCKNNENSNLNHLKTVSNKLESVLKIKSNDKSEDLESDNKCISRFLNFQDISISETKILETPAVGNKNMSNRINEVNYTNSDEKIFDFSSSKVGESCIKEVTESEIKKNELSSSNRKNFLNTPPRGTSKQVASLFDSFGK